MPQFLLTAAPDSRFCGSCCRTLCACVMQVIFVWVLMGLCWSGCHGGDVSQHVCVFVWSGRCVLHMASQDTTKCQNWHDHLPRSTTYRTPTPLLAHIFAYLKGQCYSICSPPHTQKYSNLILHDQPSPLRHLERNGCLGRWMPGQAWHHIDCVDSPE